MKKVYFRLIILFLTSRIPRIINPWMKRREKHTFEPGRRIPRILAFGSLFSLLILMSWQFLFTREIILPSEPYRGIARFIWLDSINLYLREGKILMFPKNTIIQDVREVRPKEDEYKYPFIVLGSDQRLEDVWAYDDQGYPFIISVFGRLWGLGEATPATFIKFNYLLLVIIGILSSVLLFLSFKSLLISITFFYFFLRIHIYDGYIDHHWMIGAMMIFYLSFLIFFLRSRKNFRLYWFGFYFLAAGIANIVRGGDGVIGLLLVFAVFVMTSWNNGFKEYFDKKTFPSYFLLAVFLIFVYLLPGFILGGARYFRDWAYFNSDHSDRLNYHGFWNGAFMGLGYVSNSYGLKWDDELPVTFARKIDPNVKFHTREYNDVMRQLYIGYSFKHPDLWFGNLFAKVKAIHNLAGWWIWQGSAGLLPKIISNYLIYITIASIFILSRKDKVLKTISWVVVASLLVSSAPGLIALPTSFYLKGFLASIFMSFFYLATLLYLRLTLWRI